MGIFDEDIFYNRDDYDELSFSEHRDLFLRIRKWVVDADKQVRYNKDKYRKLVTKKIEEIAGYACTGHIPSQDYMGYIYKRGFSDFFPINYKRALEWNIIAARNSSKLAPQKMKAFLNPAIDRFFDFSVIDDRRFKQIVKVNGLNQTNYYWFLSQYICDILYGEMKLNPAEMAKKELIEEDLNATGTIISLDRMRDRSVNQAFDKLIKELPADLKDEEDDRIIVSAKDLENPDEDDDINIDVSKV